MLDLSESAFDEVLVANKQLPKSLEFARFASSVKGFPRIAMDAKKVDKRVQHVASGFSIMV